VKRKSTYPRESIQHSRPTDTDTHARPARKVAIGTRGQHGGLLVAEADEVDAQVHRLLGDVDDRQARQTEEHLHAQVVQRLGDEGGAEYHGGLGSWFWTGMGEWSCFDQEVT
jgi:hypothetical protein